MDLRLMAGTVLVPPDAVVYVYAPLTTPTTLTISVWYTDEVFTPVTVTSTRPVQFVYGRRVTSMSIDVNPVLDVYWYTSASYVTH